ncbi:MAG: SGNH/GDSL hydrolase family protein [Bacteroidales bacterium]
MDSVIRISLITVFSLFIGGCANTNPDKRDQEKTRDWDLVYISDSTGWGVAKKYANNIEDDTGKTVHVKDYATGGLSAIEVFDMIKNSAMSKEENLKSAIAEADVIVLFVNPRGDSSRGGVKAGLENCIDYESGNPPDSCSVEMYHPYTENLKSIYEAIFTLRNGQPTIIRATDFYNPVISEHRKHNMETECTECLEAFNIPLISIYDAFNGSDHFEDPREKGYIGDDGIHASEKGRQVIADLLSDVGYEPVKR